MLSIIHKAVYLLASATQAVSMHPHSELHMHCCLKTCRILLDEQTRWLILYSVDGISQSARNAQGVNPCRWTTRQRCLSSASTSALDKMASRASAHLLPHLRHKPALHDCLQQQTLQRQCSYRNGVHAVHYLCSAVVWVARCVVQW